MIMEGDYKVKSLKKALNVLECFSVQAPELGITEIGQMLSLNKSNVHNIITTLEQCGYVRQNPLNGKYSLSLKIMEFSFVVNEHLGYVRQVYDIVDELSNRVNQIVYFAVPRDLEVFYLHGAHPRSQLRNFPYRLITGEKCPMHCSSLGKSMLAFSGEKLMEKLRDTPLARFTANTITDFAALKKEIAKIRENGYATDMGEHEHNAGAVGVPVLNRQGDLVAAMSVYGMVDTIRNNVAPFSEALKEAAFHMRERF